MRLAKSSSFIYKFPSSSNFIFLCLLVILCSIIIEISDKGLRSFIIAEWTYILPMTLILNISRKNEFVPAWPCSIISNISAFSTKFLTLTIMSPEFFEIFCPDALRRVSKSYEFKYKSPFKVCSCESNLKELIPNSHLQFFLAWYF